MTVNLPALPSVADARLPDTYESAQKAIAQCDRIDECKSWADKSAALASYARQAKDDTMRLMALRIQQRATRRMGELLKLIEPARNQHDARTGAGTSRTRVSEEAGLSKRQKDTALRLANVPESEFVQAINSERPPTITELAMRGTASRPAAPLTIAAADPSEAGETQSALQAFAEFCREHDASSNAVALSPADAEAIRACVGRIDAWLDRFVTHLAR